MVNALGRKERACRLGYKSWEPSWESESDAPTSEFSQVGELLKEGLDVEGQSFGGDVEFDSEFHSLDRNGSGQARASFCINN